MDPFARYLLALHLAFAMPDAPPAIFTPPGAPSPSAPGAVHAVPSRTPGTPGAVHAVPSPNPATPAVIHAPPMAGGSGYTVSGIVEAGINGPLIEGSGIMLPVDPGGRPLPGTKFYTTDGAVSKPATGHWVCLFRRAMVAPSSQTIDAVFPPANYYAAGKEGDEIGTQLRVGYTDYILVPSPARWVLYSDGTNTNAGSTVITAGQQITLFSGWSAGGLVLEDSEISGGFGATWMADPATEFIWVLQHAYNNSFFFEGDWSGQGTSPVTATWNTSIYKTGTPAITASVGLTTPPSIHTPPTRTPGNPPVITP